MSRTFVKFQKNQHNTGGALEADLTRYPVLPCLEQSSVKKDKLEAQKCKNKDLWRIILL